MKRLLVGALLVAAMAFTPGLAHADTFSTVSFVGSGTTAGLGATALFDVTGSGTLIITLTNTGTADPSDPSQILEGLLFSITIPGGGADPTLSPIAGNGSAVVGTGSTLLNNTGTGSLGGAGTSVASQWGFEATPGLASADYGFAAAGFGGAFGSGSIMCTSGCTTYTDGGTPPDGLQFGIVPTANTVGNDNGGMHYPLVDNSVVFTLTGLSGGFLASYINNVSFAYGTAPDIIVSSCTPTNPACNATFTTPEPASLALLGTGLGILGVKLRKRKAKAA